MSAFAEYARVRTAFEVSHVLDVTMPSGGLGGMVLSERRLEVPYTKDYDADEDPLAWCHDFDMSSWGLLTARADGRWLSRR